MLAAGYEVHAYASSGELLKNPVTDKNACLVLDARMPGLSGVELHAELAKKGIKLPVIFVTADDDKEIRKKARAFKAAGFFRKPVDGRALLDTIVWAGRHAQCVFFRFKWKIKRYRVHYHYGK